MLEEELEPFCFLQRFQQDQIFSQDEIESIRKHGSRRYRANEFLRLLQAKGNPAMEAFMDEERGFLHVTTTYPLTHVNPVQRYTRKCDIQTTHCTPEYYHRAEFIVQRLRALQKQYAQQSIHALSLK